MNRSLSFYSLLCAACLCIVFCNAPLYAQTTTKASSPVVDSLEQELKQDLHDTLRVRVLIRLAATLSSSDPSASLDYAAEAMQVAERLKDDAQTAHVNNIIGTVYQMKADYKKAMFYYLKALRMLGTDKNIPLQITILTNIGSCYGLLGQFEHAKQYFKKGVVLCNKHQLDRSLSFLYNNLGQISLDQNNVPEAIDYLNLALKQKIPNTDNSSLRSIIYGNLGDAYIRQNQLSNAEYCYKKALESINPRDAYNRIVSYLNLGKLNMQKENYKEAELMFFKAKEISEQTNVHLSNDRLYDGLARLYEKQNDFRNAYKYSNMYHAIKDSTTNEKIAQQIAEMQAKYESDKKDKEIQLLNKEKQIAENKAEKERLLTGFAIVALLLILIIGFVLVRVFVLKQRVKNKLYAEEKAIIEKDMVKLLHENSEARYEVLKSKTNPHFLFNSLTTLSSMIIEEPSSALEFIDRFSSLYRMILETGETKLITLKDELRVVNDYLYLQKMKFGDNLHITTDIPKEAEKWVVPPFALQMIVENASKHNIISASHPLKITIGYHNETLVISNNLQKRNSQFVSTSIGQKNIMERYKALSARLPVFTETADTYTVILPLLPASAVNRPVYEEENLNVS